MVQADGQATLEKEVWTIEEETFKWRQKVVYEDMEEILFDWVLELRSRNLRVSRRMITEEPSYILVNRQPMMVSRQVEGGFSGS